MEYLRARYYDSETGRFNTLDSYLGDIVNPQSLNRYVYAENNPVNKIDPSGHKSRKTTKITSNINTPVNNVMTLIGVLIAAGGYVYKKHVEKEAQNNNDNIEKTNNRLAKKHREFGDVAKSIEYAEYKGIHASLSDRIENYTSYPLSNEAYQKQRYLDKVYEGGEILSEIALLSFEKRLQCDKSKKLDRKNTFANGAIMIGSGVALLGLTPYVAEAALAETGTLAIADTSMIGGVTYRMAAEGITTFVGATEYSLGASELIEGATGFNPISDVLLPNDKELYEGIVDDVNIATKIGLTYGFYGYIYDNMYNNKPPIPPDEAAAKKYADNGGSGTTDINSKLIDGSSMKTDDVLDLASDFLGDGYTEPVPGSGRFVSADGTRVFRMGENDILGRHGGGPHVNFEFLEPDPSKPGKMQVVKNIHIYLED